MQELKNTEEKIIKLLEENPSARDMTNMEFLKLYWETYDGIPMPFFFLMATDAETIRRSCQKVKDRRPDLKENHEVRQAKLFKEEKMHNYYRQ